MLEFFEFLYVVGFFDALTTFLGRAEIGSASKRLGALASASNIRTCNLQRKQVFIEERAHWVLPPNLADIKMEQLVTRRSGGALSYLSEGKSLLRKIRTTLASFGVQVPPGLAHLFSYGCLL
uniref:LAGLIDADG homing endonuclease n=1 Tax=Globodera rostochiensis TaxID=31243 RepID=A0A914HM64_GLORO